MAEAVGGRENVAVVDEAPAALAPAVDHLQHRHPRAARARLVTIHYLVLGADRGLLVF